jgi:hypothetical protein
MSSKAGSIGLILGGVALVYLAATGYAGGVWDALHGPGWKKDEGVPADAGGGGGKPVEYKQAGGYAQAGGASRALGRGMGGQVSNMPYVDRGVFYASPSGGMMVSDSGIW